MSTLLAAPTDLSDEERAEKEAKLAAKTNVLHHRVVLSYLKNSLEKGEGAGYSYPCLCRRVRVEATYRRYEAWEKKMGKMHWVSRNVFVPPYEYIEVTVCNRQKTWMGKLLYDSHNVSRVRATRDDTWTLDYFMDTLQKALQRPQSNAGLLFLLREEPDPDQQSGSKTRLMLEVKEKTGGRTVVYIQPLALNEAEPGIRTAAAFVKEAYAINLEALCRYCRTGRVSKAKLLIEEGFTDAHAFPERDGGAAGGSGGAGGGWCALQWAADRGQRKTVLWLLDEIRVDPQSRSADGWTAMHCASKNGHFEVCKIFYERGASLHDETRPGGSGLTPIMLMMENGHAGMLRFFLNEQSRFAQECYAAQGVRNKEMPPNMYLTLKPLPPEVMKEIRRAKRIKRAQLDEARARQARLDAGLPADLEELQPRRGKFASKSASGKGAGAGAGAVGSASGKRPGGASPSPSPSRQGTAAGGATRQDKGQVSPASSVSSKTSSRASPSPPRRK